MTIPSTNSSRNYIDSAKFTDLLITYKLTRNSIVLDRLTRAYFYPLARGVMQKFDMKLVDKEDALQEIVIQCMTQIERFDHLHPTRHRTSTDDPNRKAFSFFTTCAKHALLGLNRIEKSKIDKTQKYRREVADAHARQHGIPKSRMLAPEDVYAGGEEYMGIEPEFQDWET